MAKTFDLIARYRDGTSIGPREYRGQIAGRNLTEAKARFADVAARATGFPTLLVLKA